MATKDTKAETGRGRGKGSGKGGGRASSGTFDTARRLQELDGHSVEAESNFEILRAQRAAARQGKKTFKDIRENEGVDEDDPLNSIDDGIRLEPFNMRREMREGHFDESGFYVLNKDEEKKVTDAWLDTVDQAERTATFKAAEKQNKASNAAANRLNAMAKNLGPDSEGEEDEDDKDDKDEKDEEEEKEKAKEAAKEEEEPEEDKEAEERNIINMLEELIVFLQPLETPAMALGRIRRGGTPKAPSDQLKTRARLRQARAGARAGGAGSQAQDMEAEPKPKRKKFNEWGYEDGQAAPDPADPEDGTTVSADGKEAKTAPDSGAFAEKALAQPAVGETTEPEQELAKAEAAKRAAQAAVEAERQTEAERLKAQAEKSTVIKPEAVAEAAAKAQADEQAQAEAAKAFAAEMKMSRNIARALVPEQGPEAAAIVNLNSEETRDVREKAMPKAPEEQPADGPPRPGQKRKQVSEGDVEKREKISRLTDLCNSLLERGVLVYDSARELLAIDVRQRKGEQLAPDADAKAPSAEAAPKAAAAKAATPTPEVQYTNKRFKAENGTSTAVTEMSDAATAAATVSAPASLFWQFRWGHNPGEINGPFDSVTMQGWVMQGCFSEDRPAEVRQCNERNEPQEQCWHPWHRIDFELYI